jgi:hypothetical protein
VYSKGHVVKVLVRLMRHAVRMGRHVRERVQTTLASCTNSAREHLGGVFERSLSM